MILLSVFTVAHLGILSLVYSFPVISRALTIASCSAWLLEHLLWSVYLDWCTSLFWIKSATPAPTLCSLLLPSVKICLACSSFCSVTDRVCRVEPVFRLYFVVYLVCMTVPHGVV